MATANQTPGHSKAFEDLLNAAPEAPDGDKLSVTGLLMRTKAADRFALQTADGSVHEVPKAAVQAFEAVDAGAGAKGVTLTLSRAALPEAIRGGLEASAILKRPPFDTLKEMPFDTLKEGPSDTLKEQPFDTLKEIGHDTIKEQPFDTLKEGPFDTLKELPGDGGGTGIADSLVEGIQPPGGELVNPALQSVASGNTEAARIPIGKSIIGDTHSTKDLFTDPLNDRISPKQLVKEAIMDPKHLKEIVKEIPKEVAYDPPGGGGGTWVENIPNPGDILTNPALRAMQAQAPQPTAAAGDPRLMKSIHSDQLTDQPTRKEIAQDERKLPVHDTIKELAVDNTLKELVQDPKHLKELVKEIAKEVAWEGTGPGDTLVEGIPNWGDIVTNPAVQQAGLGVPFVLATPHQASQGAVAQQMLAAQALMGRLGY